MTTTDPAPTALRGDADMYTPAVLAIYDPIALGMVCPLAWRCSGRTMLRFYDRNISGDHLDVGPGSGYFLDHCRFPVDDPSVVITDLSRPVLDKVSARIERYRPEALIRDALAPLDLGERRFDSAALFNVLHCLPGSMAEKAVALDHAAACVRPGGRLFGATVLGRDVPLSRFGHWMMDQYNKAGSFQNRGDSRELLEAELAKRFTSFRTRTVGALGFFEVDL